MAACRQIRSEFSERPSLLIILRYGWTLGRLGPQDFLGFVFAKAAPFGFAAPQRWPCPRHVHRAMAYCLQPASAAGSGAGRHGRTSRGDGTIASRCGKLRTAPIRSRCDLRLARQLVALQCGTRARARWIGCADVVDGAAGLPSLADTIAAVRRELSSALAAGPGQPAQFRAGPVELEFEIAVTCTGSGQAGVHLSVLTLGAQSGPARATTQRIKVMLQPLDQATGKDAQATGARQEPGVKASGVRPGSARRLAYCHPPKAGYLNAQPGRKTSRFRRLPTGSWFTKLSRSAFIT